MAEIDIGEPLMRWEFDEYHRPHRGTKWYFFATIIGGALLLYSVFTGNYIFGVIIILVALIYFLYDVHAPPKTSFTITTSGVKLGRKYYKYRELDDFWIVYRPGDHTHHYINPSRMGVANLSIPLDEEDPLQIRELLLQYIPENEHEDDEPLSEVFGKILKL
jgi:hypothetical protein